MSDQSEITPHERELEQALRTLRPAAARLSADAIVRAAVRRARQRRMRLWQAAAAAAFLAAAVPWLVRGLSGPTPSRVLPHEASATLPVIAAPNAGDAFAGGSPTLLAYRRALAKSLHELDALLDRQGGSGGTQEKCLTSAGISTFGNTNLPLPLGDLR